MRSISYHWTQLSAVPSTESIEPSIPTSIVWPNQGSPENTICGGHTRSYGTGDPQIPFYKHLADPSNVSMWPSGPQLAAPMSLSGQPDFPEMVSYLYHLLRALKSMKQAREEYPQPQRWGDVHGWESPNVYQQINNGGSWGFGQSPLVV